MDTNVNVYTQNFWYANNYGACLTAYALYNILETLERVPLLIDTSKVNESLSYLFGEFIKKYCKTISQNNIHDISKSVFITGSDQVFRPKLTKDRSYQFMLDFVQAASKKIAFSASFGVDKERFLKENTPKTINKMKASLKSFDFISVREKSGVEICKDLFDVAAEWIIDPVFILDKNKYIELAKNSSFDYSNKIISYILDPNKKYQKAYNHINKQYNTQTLKLAGSNIQIENWLSAIKDCKLLITDSFHGICFAIIFNKPFICIINSQTGATRYDSVFEMLDIDNQCIKSIDEIYKKDCIFKIDYEKVNKRIEEERQRGLDFLKKVLEAPAGKFKEKQEVRTRFLEEKICELEEQATLKYQVKKNLWELWLIIFHKYLPEFLKNIIRKLRNLNANRRK